MAAIRSTRVTARAASRSRGPSGDRHLDRHSPLPGQAGLLCLPLLRVPHRERDPRDRPLRGSQFRAVAAVPALRHYLPGGTALDQLICLRGAIWRLYPCRLWAGGLTADGYGKTWIQGRNELAHRTELARKLGRPIKPGLRALHHCDVRSCCEPQHLYEGTQRENMRDMTERDRGRPLGRPAIPASVRAEIRNRYDPPRVTQASLAREFGVHVSTINRIVNRLNLRDS